MQQDWFVVLRRTHFVLQQSVNRVTTGRDVSHFSSELAFRVYKLESPAETTGSTLYMPDICCLCRPFSASYGLMQCSDQRIASLGVAPGTLPHHLHSTVTTRVRSCLSLLQWPPACRLKRNLTAQVSIMQGCSHC